MTDSVSIVVIGATGHFGKRICLRLLGEPDTRLLVSSRELAKAKNLASELSLIGPDQNIIGVELDHLSANFADNLAALKPYLVIHTAGPYQSQDYQVAQACIQCGSHYIDLADGRDFVGDFHNLDEQAKQANVLLISGASTLPGLSSAVIDHYRSDFENISSIHTTIAPAHQTPRGFATVGAVLGYCGKPFKILEQGNWITRYGWQDLRRQKFKNLSFRLSGVCDVPDLALLPEYVPGVRTVTFHAALEAIWEQLALWILSWLVRFGIIKEPSNLISFTQRISKNLLSFGSKTGGMQIRILGQEKQFRRKEIVWELIAHKNHGPEIPVSPALIIARQLVKNRSPMPGARACLGLFSLDDFDTEVANLDIAWTADSQLG